VERDPHPDAPARRRHTLRRFHLDGQQHHLRLKRGSWTTQLRGRRRRSTWGSRMTNHLPRPAAPPNPSNARRSGYTEVVRGLNVQTAPPSRMAASLPAARRATVDRPQPACRLRSCCSGSEPSQG
jgi:hypothetical protein